jgi:hypothetical protein
MKTGKASREVHQCVSTILNEQFTLYVLLLPLLASPMRTAPTGNKSTLMDNGALQRNSYPNYVQHHIPIKPPNEKKIVPFTSCPRSQHTYRATSIVSHTRAFPHAWCMECSTAGLYWITSTARRAPLANEGNLSLIGFELIMSSGRKVACPARWVRMYYIGVVSQSE